MSRESEKYCNGARLSKLLGFGYWVALALSCGVLVLGGCGGFASERQAMREGNVASESSSTSSNEGRVEYPEGPYGSTVNAVFGNVTFTTGDGEEFSLADARALGGSKIILSTAAGWCSVCREEQDRLEAIAELRADVTVLVAIFQDTFYSPASESYVADWKTGTNQEMTHAIKLADSENRMSAFYESSVAPLNMLLDTETMVIESMATGSGGLVSIEQILGL